MIESYIGTDDRIFPEEQAVTVSNKAYCLKGRHTAAPSETHIKLHAEHTRKGSLELEDTNCVAAKNQVHIIL